MTEVREVTRRAPTLARSVINSSVIPSTKYSWDGSPDKLSSGRTAMERIGGTAVVRWEIAGRRQRARAIMTTVKSATARAARALLLAKGAGASLGCTVSAERSG